MTVPDDPEFLLAAACCRWPPAPARDVAVRAATRGVDWERFGRVVKRQRVAGLVDAALRAAGVTLPDEVAAPIAREAHRIARQNLVAASETARLVSRIAEAGHAVLAVKGVALGALAYRSIGLKHSKDIDLLVLPEAAGAVLALLEQDGYRLVFPADSLTPAQRRTLTAYGKDAMLVDRHGHQVELHWRLFDSRAMLPGITASSPVQIVPLGGQRSVSTLAQPDLYAYLALHGATDGWSRLKWLADVNALLAPLDEATVAALHAHAEAAGAGAASAQALLLIRDLFGRPLPAPLAALAEPPRRVRLLVAGAYRMMVARDGARETSDWWGGQLLSLAMQPLLRTGLRHKLQVVRSVLYLQPAMYRSAIPPSLYAVYPLIRVPAWAWRRARLGLRAGPRGTTAPSDAQS